MISGSVSGYTDISVAETYYFAVKRSSVKPTANIQGHPLIDDVCFIFESEGEEGPEETYVVLDKNLMKKGGASGHRLLFAYHSRRPQGLCNVKYEAATMDRYPQKVRTEPAAVPCSAVLCDM